MMKRTITTCLTFAMAVSPLGFGQMTSTEKVDLGAIYKIKDQGINHSEVMETLSYLTDVNGPRLSGSPSLRGAQKWAQDQLKSWGLENVGTHSYNFGRGWQLKKFSAHMMTPQYAPLIAYAKAWTPGFANGPVKAEAVRVDIAAEADMDQYKGKLKGMYVLTQPARAVEAHFTPQGTRYTDAELDKMGTDIPEAVAGGRGGRGGRGGAPAAGQPAGGRGGAQALARKINDFYIAEGVVATVEPGRGDGGTVFVASGGDRAKDAPAVPSQIVVAAEQYNRMVRIIEKKIPVTMEVDFQAEFTNPDGMEYNVVGEIPGTDKKDEVVMVGGHFDSWHTGTGATDNAAGSATAMEVMRIIKQAGLKPRRTIRIGLWSGEEEGLLGSRAYVNDTFASRPAPPPGQFPGGGGGGRGGQQAPMTPKPAWDKFAGYFNIDNGTGKIRGIYLQGNEEVRPIFEAWLAPFKDMGASAITIRNTGGTDHQAFDGVGLPGFQFIQDEVEYMSRTHHSNQDVYDRIQRADLVQISVIEAAFVYNAAMREQKLPRKPAPPIAGAPARTSGTN